MPLPCCSNCSFLVGLLGFLQQLRRPQLELIAALAVGGLDEIAEERMRPVWTRPEPGEKLAGHEPGVIRERDDPDEAAVRRKPAEDHPRLVHHFAVLVVELDAGAVTVVSDLLTV